MGSVGTGREFGTGQSQNKPAGYIAWPNSAYQEEFTEAEVKKMVNSKVFQFNVRKQESSGVTVVDVMDTAGSPIVKLKVWFDSVDAVDNKLNGREDVYKNFGSAIDGITRQYNTWKNRRK